MDQVAIEAGECEAPKIEQAPNPSAEQPEEVECQICFGSSADNEQGELKFITLGGCSHSFCSECFEETFRSLIEDQNQHSKLKCP